MQVPFSEHAEVSLLGRLLFDPRQVPVVAGILSAEDLYVGRYRKVYQAMLELSMAGTTIDVVTLRDLLGEEVPEEITYLEAGARGSLDEYVAIIRDRSIRRRILSAADKVSRAAADPDEDPLLAMSDIFGELVARVSTEDGLESAADAGKSYLDTLAARERGEVTGLTWGVPGLDDILLAAEGGEQILIAARPSVGKTVLAENIADHWASLGRGPVLFVSLEMRRTQLWDRGAARSTGISAVRIRKGELTPEEWVRVKAAVEQRRLMNIDYLDRAGSTTAVIRAAAAKTRVRHGGQLAAIVVDYMQIVGDENDNEVSRNTKISTALKRLAMEQNVPVLALSQFSRGAATEKPKLHHLRESGALEQNADAVIAMSGDVGAKHRYLEVLKQRQGGIGELDLILDGDICTFRRPEPTVTVAQRSRADLVAAEKPPTRAEIFEAARAGGEESLGW